MQPTRNKTIFVTTINVLHILTFVFRFFVIPAKGEFRLQKAHFFIIESSARSIRLNRYANFAMGAGKSHRRKRSTSYITLVGSSRPLNHTTRSQTYSHGKKGKDVHQHQTFASTPLLKWRKILNLLHGSVCKTWNAVLIVKWCKIFISINFQSIHCIVIFLISLLIRKNQLSSYVFVIKILQGSSFQIKTITCDFMIIKVRWNTK